MRIYVQGEQIIDAESKLIMDTDGTPRTVGDEQSRGTGRRARWTQPQRGTARRRRWGVVPPVVPRRLVSDSASRTRRRVESRLFEVVERRVATLPSPRRRDRGDTERRAGFPGAPARTTLSVVGAPSNARRENERLLFFLGPRVVAPSVRQILVVFAYRGRRRRGRGSVSGRRGRAQAAIVPTA